MVMKWTSSSWSVVACSVLAGSVGIYQYLAWRSRRPPSESAPQGCVSKQNTQKLTKEQRKVAKRSSRREKKDQQLLVKKRARAQIRTAQQHEMTDEQKREQMERTKMQRVEQYQKLDDGRLNGVRAVVDLGFAAAQSQRVCLHCAATVPLPVALEADPSVRVGTGFVVYAGMQQHLEAAWLEGNRRPAQQPILRQCKERAHLRNMVMTTVLAFDWHVQVTCHQEPVQELFTPQEIVYLSPDSENVLDTVDPKHVYVIGGIVDRSVRKGQSLEKAGEFAYRTARLPLQEHLSIRTHILNIDSVLICLNEYMNHQSWPRAFAKAIPKRITGKQAP